MENENNLTIADLQQMITVIDAVTERGAIKGDEMLTVGMLRTKIAQFIQTSADNEDEPETEVLEGEILDPEEE